MQSTIQLVKTANDYINELELKPHPLGCGFYSETDRDNIMIQIINSNEEVIERNISTCIIALFKGNQLTPLHRTKSTQIIHFYPGGNTSLRVHIIEYDGIIKTYRMPEEQFQLKIPALTWFAFEVENKDKNAFVITGHTVSPGFDIKDYELATKLELILQYPSLATFISKFTFETS